MAETFGNQFVNQFGEKDSGIWFDGLREFTPEDLTYGYRKLRRHMSEGKCSDPAYPPNLIQFIRYCVRQYDDFGLLTPAQAFKEVENNRYMPNGIWSHPLVYLVSYEIDLLASDERRDLIYRNFIDLYTCLALRYMRGEKIDVSERILNARYHKRDYSIVVTGTSDQKTIQFKQDLLI